MKKLLFIVFLLLGFSSSSAYADCYGADGNWVSIEDCPVSTRADGLSDKNDENDGNDEKDFGLDDLIKTSIEGMFDSDCGSYCMIGVCAHLNWGVNWRKGPYLYTIISPQLRTAVPDLLIASYNHVGEHPFDIWRDTFEAGINAANESILSSVLDTQDGLKGGRGSRDELYRHQSIILKEVSIIGHPASILPEIVRTDGSLGNMPDMDYALPGIDKLPTQNDADQVDNNSANTVDDPDKVESSDFDLSEMFDNALLDIIDKILSPFQDALDALEAVNTLASIEKEIEVIQDVVEFYDAALAATETTWRGSVYGNLAKPRFRAPRIFCPTNIDLLQPYYLSIADAFYWRIGYPLTDGPISGSDHSSTILNPLSDDTLKIDPDDLESWGHLYPRDGGINQSHDAKAATVLAWRAMDVLTNNVKQGDRTRIGVPLPTGNQFDKDLAWKKLDQGRWQMIHPEVKACQASPIYEDKDTTIDFIEINGEYGNYAWNYYNTYECCSNSKGKLLPEFPLTFPTPICL